MEIKGWKYYNHAAIPECAPHEEPDLTPVTSGEIWKLDGSPLLVRWTTDFDCGYETQFWYMVREKPFDLEALSRRSRKHIRQSLKKCFVESIDPLENTRGLYKCYCTAVEKYDHAAGKPEYSSFVESLKIGKRLGYEYWGGFAVDDHELIGYMICYPQKSYVSLMVAKFMPSRQNLGVSDALYVTILGEYLNKREYDYICSGSRNINHVTNTEQYKIDNFLYRRAYCRLHIEYSPKIRLAVRMVYPFRTLLCQLDRNRYVHMINSVLRMEEVVRKQG